MLAYTMTGLVHITPASRILRGAGGCGVFLAVKNGLELVHYACSVLDETKIRE